MTTLAPADISIYVCCYWTTQCSKSTHIAIETHVAAMMSYVSKVGIAIAKLAPQQLFLHLHCRCLQSLKFYTVLSEGFPRKCLPRMTLIQISFTTLLHYRDLLVISIIHIRVYRRLKHTLRSRNGCTKILTDSNIIHLRWSLYNTYVFNSCFIAHLHCCTLAFITECEFGFFTCRVDIYPYNYF
ncbi:hypothetical protein BS78_03G009800 [Paspalum vaginatum]|nr:hypothetical protein BS78_03G009800 [Paspalum vaginatum]